MAFYKQQEIKNGIRIQVVLKWNRGKYDISMTKWENRKTIRAKSKGIAEGLGRAMLIFDTIVKECCDPEVLFDLIEELEAKNNMLIL